jgi:hypothetical protein
VLILLGSGAPVLAEQSRYPNLAPPGDCAEPRAGWLATTPPWHPGSGPTAAGSEPPAGRLATPAQRLGSGPPAAGSEQPVGRVASLFGSARAEGSDAGTRPLTCGDPVYAGERVATSGGSSVGVLLGEVLAQLDAESAATLGLTPASTADVSLERGSVRVIDPRLSGAPVRLAARDTEASISGNDAEGHLGTGGSGFPMLCGWNAPLTVERGGETAVAVAGACVIAEPRVALRTQRAREDRIAALGATCETAPPIVPIAHLVPLPPVAYQGEGPPLPEAPDEPLRSPCDVPGAGCSGVTLEEQTPTTSPFPGDGSFDGQN